MKRILSFLLVFSLIFAFLSGCKSQEKENETAQAVTMGVEQGEEVKEERYQYDLSEYIVLGDYTAVQASFEDPDICTVDEWEDAIAQILLSQATFTRKDGPANRFDKVEFDLTVYLDGEKWEEYSQNGVEIVTGKVTGFELDDLLGEELIGAAPGEERTVSYTYPENILLSDATTGKTVSAVAKVNAVYEHLLPELDDKLVQTMGLGELKTVEEFRESVRQDILEHKKQKKVQAVWEAFVQTVTVLQYPEKELQAYMDDFESYYQNQAKALGLSFSEYLSQSGVDEEIFQQSSRSYGEEMVKNDMIFTQLSRVLNITLTQKEYQAGVERYFQQEAGSYSSVEEFVSALGESKIRQNLIWDKALLMVAENAIALEK